MRGAGELEATVMDVVWAATQPLTVREVLQSLNQRLDRAAAYTTVLTVMTNLHRKGLLLRSETERAYRYAAAMTREEFTASLMNDALATTSDRTGALLRFAQQLSADERQALLDYVAPEERPR